MNRGTSIAIALLMFISGQVLAQDNTFDGLKAKFDEGLVFYAEFNSNEFDSYTEETNRYTGKIWIDDTGYKVEGEAETLVIDGELSRVYNSERNRVIINDYDPMDDSFAPSKLLSGSSEEYTSSEKKLFNGNILITLLTQDEFSDYVKVEIELNKDLEPVKITAYDFAENIYTTTFSNGKFIKKTPNIFKLIYPEDAETVDMRY